MEPRPVQHQGRAALTRRRLLQAGVKAGLLLLAAAFAGIFVYGMFGPGMPAGGDSVDIGGLPPGSARLEGWNGKPVWVVHRTPEQLQALVEMADHVTAPAREPHPDMANPHRSLKQAYGIYLAATGRAGVLVQYLRERPDGLDPAGPWHGGFIDPGTGALFDAAGRRYHGTPGGPLEIPPHRYTGATQLMLGAW